MLPLCGWLWAVHQTSTSLLSVLSDITSTYKTMILCACQSAHVKHLKAGSLYSSRAEAFTGSATHSSCFSLTTNHQQTILGRGPRLCLDGGLSAASDLIQSNRSCDSWPVWLRSMRLLKQGLAQALAPASCSLWISLQPAEDRVGVRVGFSFRLAVEVIWLRSRIKRKTEMA